MAFDLGGSGDLQSDINVTPLVDVMLVLLIIFMLVTPLLQRGVAVDLPLARNVHGVTDDPERAVTVTIPVTGGILIDGRPLAGATLAQVLTREHASNSSLELHVKADRNVPYGEVRRVILAGREAGFHNAALVAEEVEDNETSGGGT